LSASSLVAIGYTAALMASLHRATPERAAMDRTFKGVSERQIFIIMRRIRSAKRW
jgi:hypothetical protein